MLWLYDIRNNFISICESLAKMEPIRKEPSSPLLPTVRAGKGGCDVTARDHKSLSIKDILYVFE